MIKQKEVFIFVHFNRLKDLRTDFNYEQSEIAKLLGISQQYYSRYELNEIDMPIRHLMTLAQFYNVSIDYICGLINTPKTLNGKPYIINNKGSNNININAGNGNKINIKK